MKINTNTNINKISILLFLILSYEISFSQVAGISNSKVIVICPETVEKHKFEFEPAFTYSNATNFWSHESKLIGIDNDEKNRLASTDYGFRFTYGIYDNLEAGLALSGSMDGFSAGAKYRFFANNSYEFAFFGGVNLSTEESGTYKIDEKGINQNVGGIGLVGRKILSENLTLDLDVQYLNSISRSNDNYSGDLLVNSEIGYYLDKYQFCAGFSYSNSMNKINDNSEQLLSLILGGTIETGEDFVLIWGFPIDLYGKNQLKRTGFLFALTLTIN